MLRWATFTGSILFSGGAFMFAILIYRKLETAMIGISVMMILNPAIVFSWGVIGSSSTPSGLFPICVFSYCAATYIGAIIIARFHWNFKTPKRTT